MPDETDKPKAPPSADDPSAEPSAEIGVAAPPSGRGGVGQRPRVLAPARKKTPTSTLSLANARIPSNLPPPRTRRKGKTPHAPGGSASATDKADAVRDETKRERPARLDLDEVGFEDEHTVETVRNPAAAEYHAERPPEGRPDELEALAQAPPEAPRSRAVEMSDRIELGDYSGALEIAEEILRTTPDDAEAKSIADNCRTVLRQMYATRIGPLNRVPVVMVSRDQLRWLSIDHKAGFVLALVDGVSTLEMIIDVSGMPELDTLRILSELAQQRIISLR